MVPTLILISIYYSFAKLNEIFGQKINVIQFIRERLDKARGSYHTAQKTHLSKPPGARLLALVDFLFSPKTVELTFKQLVADWRTEYFEALKQGRTLKARWIIVRYRIRFACAFIMSSGLGHVVSLLKQIR